MKAITNPDTTNENPAYWEEVLLSHGLGMRRGEPRKESLRGGLNDLVVVEKMEYSKASGKVDPSGHGPDR